MALSLSFSFLKWGSSSEDADLQGWVVLKLPFVHWLDSALRQERIFEGDKIVLETPDHEDGSRSGNYAGLYADRNGFGKRRIFGRMI